MSPEGILFLFSSKRELAKCRTCVGRLGSVFSVSKGLLGTRVALARAF